MGNIMHWLKVSLLVGAISCAPPIEPDTPVAVTTDTPVPTTTVEITTNDDTEAEDKNLIEESPKVSIEITTVPVTTIKPHQHTPLYLSAIERKALISHLSEYDLSAVDPLVLTPRQQAAILQELEHQRLGLDPFTDPTPWQRLSREQQEEFNRKYLALRPDLQEYSKNQFLSLPDDRLEHAFQAFLSVDLQTLSDTIERELLGDQAQQQQRIAEQQRITEQQHIAEQQRIAEQQHLKEQQHITEQYSSGQQKIEEQQKGFKQQKQNEIDELYEILNPQNVAAQVRSEGNANLNHISNINGKFEHFKPVEHRTKPKESLQVLQATKNIYSPQVQPTAIIDNLGRPAVRIGNKERVTSSSSREMKRKQKRLNIRRLNFDPRRRQ